MDPTKLPPEAWLAINTLISAISVLGLAIIGYLQARQNQKIREVKDIVNGPLSVALKSNADLALKVAEMTHRPEDIEVATKAKIIDENRKEGKSAHG